MAKRKKKSPQRKKDKEILINVSPVEKRVAVLEGGELVDFFMERDTHEDSAGSIYKGKVMSILPGIEASFVDIGMEKNGFLHVSDVIDKNAVLKEFFADEADFAEAPPKKINSKQKINDILKINQELLVQVVKESIGTKGPRITTYISLAGRFLVLTPFDPGIGISRRITDRDERKRILTMIKEIGLPEGIGCIVRTVAEKTQPKEVNSEIKYLLGLWEKVKSRAEKQSAPFTVYEEYGLVLRMIRDTFTEAVTNLVVDSKDEYLRIIKFLKSFSPEMVKRVKLYKGRTALFQKYDLDKKIEQIFKRKVDLKSGGHLVIEQTEGVVVVDVNTGSFVGKKSLEETAFKTNLEAAEEIPKQLMLRDIGGIIIIDFIDMDVKEHRDKIFFLLQDSLKSDKAKISVREISQFGIVEMTRQRMRKSLERSSYKECPYCVGKGMIKSADTVAIETVRKIDKIISTSTRKTKNIAVSAHPEVVLKIISDQAKMLSDIQRKYRVKIDIKEDYSLHFEEVIVEEK